MSVCSSTRSSASVRFASASSLASLSAGVVTGSEAPCALAGILSNTTLLLAAEHHSKACKFETEMSIDIHRSEMANVCVANTNGSAGLYDVLLMAGVRASKFARMPSALRCGHVDGCFLQPLRNTKHATLHDLRDRRGVAQCTSSEQLVAGHSAFVSQA